MQATQHTVNYLSEQPGLRRNGGMCPSVHQRLTSSTVNINLCSDMQLIVKQQFGSIAGYIGMT